VDTSFEFKGKHSHRSISICQKAATFNFLQGSVTTLFRRSCGTFYRTMRLIYPRHCISTSTKIGQVL